MTLATTERQVGKTQLRLTQRGKIVVAGLVATLGFLIIGLINVNLLTPAECRNGILDIKKTDECRIYLIGAP